MSKNETVDLKSLDTPAPAEKKIPVPPAALTPEMQSYLNSTLSATIKEVMAGIMPMLSANAMTPEKLTFAFTEAERLRRLPTDEQERSVARQKREKAMMKEELEQNRKNLQHSQDNCLHKYVSGAQSVSAIRNYPDRQARFVCHKCMEIFQPRHWEILAPTAEFPRGVEKIVDAHRLYVQIAKEWSLSHES